MSYYTWLAINTGSVEPFTVAECGNMTSNVAPVWRAAGADLRDFDGRLAGECLPAVTEALAKISRYPRSYEYLVRGEGRWGTVDSAIRYLTTLEENFKNHPLATVHVSW